MQYLSETKIYTNTVISLNGTEFGSSSTPSWINACVADDKQSFSVIICLGDGSADESGYWLKIKAGTEDTYRYVKLPDDLTLTAGKHYTYNLTVGKDLVSVGGVTVNDWTTDDDTTINAPDADEVVND